MTYRPHTYFDTGDRVVIRDGDAAPSEVHVIVNEHDVGMTWKTARKLYEGLEIALRERSARGLSE